MLLSHLFYLFKILKFKLRSIHLITCFFLFRSLVVHFQSACVHLNKTPKPFWLIKTCTLKWRKHEVDLIQCGTFYIHTQVVDTCFLNTHNI